MRFMTWLRNNAMYLIFAQALAAVVGSLYFSEVRHLAPCILCWYQRIAMYPIVVISAVAILRDDRKGAAYILPLGVIGLAIAAYHNLLYYGVLPENIQPCTFGVSCTTKFIEWLGFITIPFLSFLSFAVVTGLSWFLLKEPWKKGEKV